MKEIRNLLMVLAVAVVFVSCGGEEAESDQYGQQMDEQVAEQEEEQTGTTTEETQQEETEVIDPDMTEEEMTSWVMENCICPDCPSWVPGAGENGEGGYCKTGTSEYITEEVQCICGGCPVTEELGLQWGYYCTRGSAEEMREQQQQSP